MRRLVGWSEWLLIGLVVIYPGLYYPLSFLPLGGSLSFAGALNVALSLFCLALTALLLWVRGRTSPLVLFALGFVAALVYAVLVSPDPGYSLRPFTTFAVQVLVFTALATNPAPTVSSRTLVRAMLAGMVLPVAIALLQAIYFVPGISAFLYSLPFGFQGAWSPDYPGIGNRLAGTFAVHVYFAQAVGMLCLTLLLIGEWAIGWVRWPYLGMALTCLLLSWTRTAWLATGMAVGLVALLSRKLLGSTLIVLSCAVVATVAIEIAGDGVISSLFISRSESNLSSINDRLALLLEIADVASPVGEGLGRSIFATMDAGASENLALGTMTGQTAHNVVVSAYIEGGVVLLLAYLALLAGIGRFGILLLRTPTLERFGLLVLGGGLIVVITGLTEDSFNAPGVLGYWVILAAAERQYRSIVRVAQVAEAAA